MLVARRFALPLLALLSLLAGSRDALAATVGYYDMSLGSGDTATQPGPITAAGQTPIRVFDLTPAELSGLDVLMVQNPSNGLYGTEYLAHLSDIQSAVSAGLILVLHDRYVSNGDGTGGAKTILPGGSGFAIIRNFVDPNAIDIRDASTPVTSGIGGTLTNSSLDGGVFSSHGFADPTTLPALSRLILSRTNPQEVVAFSYPFGDGAVYYSTMPLDQFLAGGGTNPPQAAFVNIYAPNVVDYAARLSLGLPDLGVTITDNRTEIVPGETATYFVTVRSFGIGAATGATVTTSLGPNVSGISWTCVASGGSCAASGSGNLATSFNLSPGGVLVYTLTGLVAPAATGSLTTSAAVQLPGGPDPFTGNNTATDVDTLTPRADLALAKTGPAQATPGSPLSYTLTVTNAGPSTATTVQLSDPTPAGLVFASAGAPCAMGLPCELGNLAPNASASVTVTFDVPQPYLGPDPVLNLANVSAATSDPVADNNVAQASTPAGHAGSADLRLTAGGPPSAARASSVTFILTVTNLGSNDAAGVQITHTPPPGLLLASVGPGCASFPCSLGALNAGASRSVRVTYNIPGPYAGADPLVESATVASSTTDPVAGNNSATASVPLGADTADLAVAKSGPTAATRGQTVTYLLRVDNRGPATATGVLLDDPTPAGLTWVSADPPCAGGFPCNLGSLAAGARREVRTSFLIPAGYSGADPITNTAMVVGDQPEGNGADNTSTLLTGLAGAAADLKLSKRAPAEVAAGTDLTYTLLVTNLGPGTAQSVTLDELSPASLSFVSATPPCQTGFPCALGNLAPGVSKLIGLVLGVAPDHVSPNPIVNQASVATTSLDPASANDTSSATTAVVYRADLGITKTDGRSNTSPDLDVTYTIVATNHGPSDVAGATVHDAWPIKVTGVSWTCASADGGTCGAPAGSGNLNDTVNLLVGGSVTYTATGHVASDATGTLVNTATVSPPAGVSDPVSANDQATDSDVIVPSSNLEVRKTGPASAVAGTPVTYTIRVTNHGPGTATNLVLADPTPAGLTFTSAGAPCGAGFPCNLPNLASGAEQVVTVTYAVPAGYGSGTISNTATATTDTPLSPASHTVDTVVTPVARQADLSATKTDSKLLVVPGQPTTYTIVVQNAGPSNVAGATVDDTPPAALLSPTWTCSAAGGASCAASGTTAIHDSVNLPAGGSVTYLLTATVDPTATSAIVNQAQVAPPAGTTDPVSGNNLGADTDGISPTADLAITKTDGRPTAVPGDPLSYTVTASNLGPSSVTGATVSDTLPATFLGATWTCTPTAGATCEAASGSGNLDEQVNLAAGSSLTFVISGTISSTATGSLANTAQVAVPVTVTDPVGSNNSASDSDTLTRVADLRVTLGGPGTVSRGGSLSYTVSVTNAGPSATQAQLTLPTPAGLGFTSAGAPCAGGFPCNLGVIAAGGSASFNVTFSVPADYAGADPIVVTAALASDAADPHPTDNSARSATAVDRAGSANLAITKTAPAVASTGSTITYILTVTNLGPDDAFGVQLGESTPAGLSFVSATAPCAGGFTCALGTLNAGESRTVEATFNLPPSYSGSSLISNTATVSATTADPAAGNNSANALTTLIAAAIDLAVGKSGPLAVGLGQNLTYTLSVTNRGPATATNTRLLDSTPAGLSFVTATAPCSGGFPCFLDTLSAGQTVTVQATYSVPAGYSGPLVIRNTAQATANESDGVSANDSATALTGVVGDVADLALGKSAPATARAGEVLTYDLLVRNLGPGSAASVTLSDPAPAGTTFVSATAPCTGGFPCSLGTLPAGTSIALQARFRTASSLAAGTTVTNTASLASAGSADPATANNSASASTVLATAADLAITKTDGLTSVAPGRPVTYTLAVTNAGPSNASSARVQDTFPAILGGVTWTCAASGGASCGGGGGSGNLDRLVDVPVGGSVTFTATGTVQPGATGTLANTATVTAPATAPDPATANNTATDSDTLTPEADLGVTKTDNQTTAVPGSPVTYTIQVSNAGPSHATGATVSDTFPAILGGVSWTCTATAGSSCSPSGTVGILDTVTLLAGGNVTYTATGTVQPGATGTLGNTASVAAPSGVSDLVPGNNSATDTDTLTPQAELVIIKDDGQATAPIGGQVTYTITVANTGPSHAPGTVVSDPFPAAITAVSWTCTPGGSGVCGAASGSGNLNETVNLPSGGSVVYHATATISPIATGTLVNIASVAPATGVTDPIPSNNSEDDSDTLVRQGDLAVQQQADRAFYRPGDPVTYTLTVGNAGPSDLPGAHVIDSFPAALSGVTWTCGGTGGGVCPASGSGNLNATVDLPLGGQVRFTVRARVTATAIGPITNTATATPPAGGTDPVSANNSAAVTMNPAPSIFADGFESGTTGAWSQVVP